MPYASLQAAMAGQPTGLPGWVTAAAPIIGSIAGAATDIYTQNQANKANARNVQAQIDFQREQSATQYQRGVKDMAAAGLNPALAYQQGGNQAASGAAARAEPLSQNTAAKFASAVDAYTAFANGVAQRDLMREQTNATAAQAGLTRFQTSALRPDAILGQSEEYVGAYGRTKFQEALARGFTAEKTPERFAADIANVGAGTALAHQQAIEARTRTTLNEQDFQNEWFRKNVSPYLNSTAKTIGILKPTWH